MTQYKAGDKVKIVGNSNHHELPIGHVTTLVERDGHEWYCEEGWLIAESDIELLGMGETSKDAYQWLLDQFAMAAMQGELSAQSAVTTVYWANEHNLAERAYDIATAMMKEREKRMKHNEQT
jgi:hypothetical protein